MVVHDEATLVEALSRLDEGPLRYSDTYAYVVISDPSTLERLVHSAFSRDDIAIVAAVGHELSMEEHAKELTRVRKQRREREKLGTQEFFREHPEAVDKVRRGAEKRGDL